MLASQKLAVAAHLHVLLRRKTGRVTDTEWMAANLEYAVEIIRFARQKASEDGHADLAEWATKLEHAMHETKAPSRPLVQSAMELLHNRGAPASAAPAQAFADTTHGGFMASVGETTPSSEFRESTLDPDNPSRPRQPDAPRYVGGLR